MYKILLLLFCLLGYVNSQAQKLEITPLTENFYVYTTYQSYKGQPVPANGLYVITKEGVILIDSPWDVAQCQPLLDSIEAKHQQKVVLCIATHSHEDRVGGFDYFREKGIKTYTSKQTYDLCKKRGEKNIATNYFVNDTTFKIGQQTFQTFYAGEGHTEDNIVVWFEKQKVLHGGCLVKSVEATDLGYIGEANLKEWGNTIKNVQNKFQSPKHIIPGHQNWKSTEALNHTLKLLKIHKIATDSLKNIQVRDSLRVFARDSVVNYLNCMLAEPDMQHATFGFCAMYANTDTMAIVRNHRQSISTASVLKTVTTAASLNLLGKDFRFETQLEYQGEIKDSILYGNLYIKGGGDPTLAFENREDLLCEWVYAIEKLGVKKIKGQIIADESIFDDKAVHNRWVWEDLASGYGAGSYGLSFHENLYYITLRSGEKEGDSTFIKKVYPPIDSLVLYNQIRAGAKDSGDNSIIYGSPDSYARVLSGTIPANSKEFVIKGAIPNPPLYCATELHKTLYYNAIAVEKLPITLQTLQLKNGLDTTKRIKFHTTYSVPLGDIIRTTNYRSVNLYAENLLRIIGYKICEKGTTEGGVKAVTEYLQQKGINLHGFFMEDGSGLSRFNAIMPEQLLKIMRLQVDEPNFSTFYKSLPVVGESGTVKNLAKNTVADGKIRAKSGSMTRVRCYTGYVTTKTGEKLVFVMMANNYSGKGSDMVKRMEKLMVMMAGLPF